MTEAEWLACTDPNPMLQAFTTRSGAAPDRKLRLFAIACCLRTKTLLADERSVNAVKVVEEFLEGKATEMQLKEAYKSAQKAYEESDKPGYWESPLPLARFAARNTAYEDTTRLGITLVFAVRAGADSAADASGEPTVEKAVQADLCRCVFGNPFRPVSFSPEWRTDTALSLARTMYDARDFSAMPILADALQDAGCDRDDILSHCRDPHAAHVRGCWVCDLVLDKG
jgi:hypothetical protein